MPPRTRATAREFLRLQDEQRREALDSQHAQRLRKLWIAGLVVVLVLGAAFGWYQRRVNRRLALLSEVDPLTGLLNRRAATARLQRESAATPGPGQRDVVFLIDIDHFKARNDGFGHAAGDAALAAVAHELRACCRADDIVARWGGDWQDAVALADRALYAAKHSGRDAWVGVWGQDDSAATIEDVINDPETHAASGAIIVVSSRELVLWHPHAGPA